MSRALITLDPTPIATPRRPLDIGSYEFEIDDGVICCGSDEHYRPDEPPSTAHRAFVQTVSRFAEEQLCSGWTPSTSRRSASIRA